MVTVARELFEIAVSLYFSELIQNYELRSSEFFHFFTEKYNKKKYNIFLKSLTKRVGNKILAVVHVLPPSWHPHPGYSCVGPLPQNK